ncbi:MAG: hypothetical protein ACLQUS_04130 [Desulfobaccales bacterium]
MRTTSTDAPVIIDEGKQWRWSKWIMNSMFAVLLVLVGIVRDCGNGEGF